MLFDKIQPDFTTELETQEEIRLSRIKNTTERGGGPSSQQKYYKETFEHTPKKKLFLTGKKCNALENAQRKRKDGDKNTTKTQKAVHFKEKLNGNRKEDDIRLD